MSVDAQAILRDLLGDSRREWPPEKFRDLFVRPAYFKKLTTRRPCILVGGRGTGKTTALRSLSFDVAQDAEEQSGGKPSTPEYLGIYVRINKTRVQAFHGPDLKEIDWSRAFAHYFNLLVCLELTKLSIWAIKSFGKGLSDTQVSEIATDLALCEVNDVSELGTAIRRAISELQIFINNPRSAPKPFFSIAEAPVSTFAQALDASGVLEDRTIFCCVDEYENLLDSQQALLNAYIKHAEPPLSYKVGVRQNGLRVRQTSSGGDLLRTPDDYREVVIADEGFDLFATAVAERRLRRARENNVPVPQRLKDFLQTLSFEEEATLLGADKLAEKVRSGLSGEVEEVVDWANERRACELYFIRYWAEGSSDSLGDLARDWMENESTWQNRLNNYGYASLFWLSKGRKGVRIRKYYAGAHVMLALSGGNIRYFLELLEEAIANEESFAPCQDGEIVVSAKAQTRAARMVGKRRLDQLSGLAERGMELKLLVLAIGKVFFELARTPIGRTPEVTSFIVKGHAVDRSRVEGILRDGVAHLAFEASPRTKATTESEIRDDEYRLHPVFSAYFEISHRRKRRRTIDASTLLDVLEKPSRAISRLLDEVPQTPEADLPGQLALFSLFFTGGDDGDD